MKLNNMDLDLITNIAIEAALSAGRIILKYKNRNYKVLNKEGGSSYASQVLTEVDILCQNEILDIISPCIKEFHLGLLTEELEDNCSRFEKEYFFSVDPMDGTKSFIESDHGFSVSISLVEKNGVPVIGVVYDPIKNNLYYGIKGHGLFKNRVKWIPKFRVVDTNLKVLVDPSFVKISTDNIEYLEYGGAVLNGIEVLEGRADCYLKLPKKDNGGGSIWDFSSITLFYNECNAIAQNMFNNPIFLNSPDTTFMNTQGVIFCKDDEVKNKIFSTLKLSF